MFIASLLANSKNVQDLKSVDYLSVEAFSGLVSEHDLDSVLSKSDSDSISFAGKSFITINSEDKSVFVIAKLLENGLIDYRAICALYSPQLNEDQIVTCISLYMNNKLH